MPTAKGTHHYIYNVGIEKRVIFQDSQDYSVFLDYLKGYLTPADLASAKKTFTVNGRVFRGLPHLAKNYFKKVELIAYSLEPTHFHLLLHELASGSLESFLRSLFTRYSMYFNKKYQRTGSLFAGPYRSLKIKGKSTLLFLSRYIHRNPHQHTYSSYPEYLGLRETPWVKPEVILSLVDASGYKNFVEKYELNQKEKETLAGITPKVAETQPPLNSAPSSPPRIIEFLAVASLVFLLLVGLAVRNINAYASKNAKSASIQPEATSEPAVSGVTTTPQPEEERTPEPETKITLVVKITDGADHVNIRQEPTVESPKIGEALDGETFDFISINAGWYEVKLVDGSTGFISSKYIEVLENIN